VLGISLLCRRVGPSIGDTPFSVLLVPPKLGDALGADDGLQPNDPPAPPPKLDVVSAVVVQHKFWSKATAP
jgi:hypothetical protein